MTTNYNDLYEVLSTVTLVILSDKHLDRLHNELIIEIKRAQNEFDLGKTNPRSSTWSREPLSPAVMARYNTLKEQLKSHHKILLPEA